MVENFTAEQLNARNERRISNVFKITTSEQVVVVVADTIYQAMDLAKASNVDGIQKIEWAFPGALTMVLVDLAVVRRTE